MSEGKVNNKERHYDENHSAVVDAAHFDQGLGMIGDQLEVLREDVRKLGESQAEVMGGG